MLRRPVQRRVPSGSDAWDVLHGVLDPVVPHVANNITRAAGDIVVHHHDARLDESLLGDLLGQHLEDARELLRTAPGHNGHQHLPPCCRPFWRFHYTTTGQNWSTSARVEAMLAWLDAPNTIDSMFGCAQTHSMASRAGMAPEAKTDIAIARNWCSSSVR